VSISRELYQGSIKERASWLLKAASTMALPCFAGVNFDRRLDKSLASRTSGDQERIKMVASLDQYWSNIAI
jgi:hypothetical protein